MKRLLLLTAGALEAEALRRALRYVPDCHVIGYADVNRPCGWTVRDARPDVIVVDDGAEGTVTLTRLREAREGAPEATIVCRTNHLEPGWPQTAVEAGADATIDTSVDAARLAVLVREIAAGTVFHAPRPHAKPAKDIASNLTARELEILKLMAAGATNSMVAAQLWVTEQTVKFHLSNVYRKLGVANRTEAAHYAHTHGLLREPARTARTGAEHVDAPRRAAAVAA